MQNAKIANYVARISRIRLLLFGNNDFRNKIYTISRNTINC